MLELCKGNKAAATGDHVAQRNRRGRVRRWVGIGAASVLGGGLLVVTGGAAAPALAAGVGALGLGGASAFLGGAGGAAVVASVLGASGAGLTGYRMRRRLSEICHFEFEAVAEVGAISAVVCVPGGVQSEAEIQNVWRFVPDVQPLTDVYNLSVYPPPQVLVL